MDSREFTGGKHLKAEHLKDLNEIYTIDSVTEEEFEDRAGKKDDKLVLYFTKKGMRPLGLNATNVKAMQALTGSFDTNAWVGTQIAFYIEQTSMGPGIRIQAPPQPPQAMAPPDTSAQEDKAADPPF